nr:MAG TPA: hypothetical protein [Caudoviricetes sp.]DAW52126.1 MAG TPA: hypothetical protein [Caudoviricetes sp.]
MSLASISVLSIVILEAPTKFFICISSISALAKF